MFASYKKILEERSETIFNVKVHAGAKNTKAKEVLETPDGEMIKIDIAAAPEKGKANQELVRFLSKEFAVPKGNVKIIGGAADKLKLIKIIRYE